MPLALDAILTSHRSGRAVVMGVLNVTPDSFSDGGRFFAPAHALAEARRLAEAGADIIDVGAESTRPGSLRVSAAEQIRRLAPVLPGVCELGPVVSIDTTRAEVAAAALDAGAGIVNDISAGRDDGGMFALAAGRGCGLVLMHMLGQPQTMQQAPHYDDVLAEVAAFLAERVAAAEAAGVSRSRLIIDPGIGFGKGLEHNLALLRGLGALARVGVPVMVGASRKRFIGELTGVADPALRQPGSIAACLAAYERGVTIFRVHDVAAVRQALAVAAAVRGRSSTD
jgi:dihydropteroate synthase